MQVAPDTFESEQTFIVDQLLAESSALLELYSKSSDITVDPFVQDILQGASKFCHWDA